MEKVTTVFYNENEFGIAYYADNGTTKYNSETEEDEFTELPSLSFIIETEDEDDAESILEAINENLKIKIDGCIDTDEENYYVTMDFNKDNSEEKKYLMRALPHAIKKVSNYYKS